MTTNPDEPNSNVIPFVFEEQLVRVFTVDGEPWFVLADLCAVLGIKNPRDAAARLDPDEVNTVGIADGNRGNPERNIVSESGLYALIFTSRKPEARRFRKWVTAEVLPAIRRTGRYDIREEPTAAPMAGDGELPLHALSVKIALVREARYTFGLRQARETWRAMGLPYVEELSNNFALSQGFEVLGKILDAISPAGPPVRDLVAPALEGDPAARRELANLGIKFDEVGGFLLVANVTAFLRRMFKGQQGSHFLALRQIPGSFVPAQPKMFGKRWSRCTAIPMAEIENELYGDRDIFEKEDAA